MLFTRVFLVPALLLGLQLPVALALFGATATVINDCSVDITVDMSGEDVGDTFQLSPGQSASIVLCDTFCTDTFGACYSYPWTYSAQTTDDCYGSTWGDVSPTISL